MLFSRHSLQRLVKVTPREVEQAWRNGLRMAPLALLLAYGLYWQLQSQLKFEASGWWLVAITLVTVVRTALAWWYGDAARAGRAAYLWLLIITPLYSLVWGLAIFMLSDYGRVEALYLLSGLLVVVGSIGVLNLLMVTPAALLFVTPVFATLLLWMLTHRPEFYQLISVLITLYWGMLVYIALNFARQYQQVKALIGDNINLTRTLTQTSDALTDEHLALKQIERRYALSDTRFKSLVEMAPDPILLVNGAGVIGFANAASLKQFGYASSELVGRPIEDLVPQRFSGHAHLRRQFMAEPQSMQMGRKADVSCLRKDGSEFPALIHLIPVEWENEWQVYTYIYDLSAQRNIDAFIEQIRKKELAESQLHEEKRRIQTYLDNIEAILLVIDEKLSLELINRKGCEILGMTELEIRSNNWMAYLFKEGTVENLRTLFLGFLTDAELLNQTYSNTVVNTAGEVKYIEWRFTLAEYRAGHPVIIASGTDITRRKHLEELITSVSASLSIHTTEGLLNSLVRGLAQTLGADAALVGRYQGAEARMLNTLVFWRDHDLVANISVSTTGSYADVVSQGHYYSLLNIANYRYPNRQVLEAVAARAAISIPLFSSGREVMGELTLFYRHPLSNISMERNICSIYSVIAAAEIERIENQEDKERMEKQLVQAQKMESIGQLTGGIAHDFNNMLASILGFTELALLRIAGTDPKLAQYLRNVYSTGEQAKELVAQMLTFSRQVQGEREALRLPSLVTEAVKMFRPMLPSSIKLNVLFDDNLPAVDGDAVLLNQALLNLLINARDAIGEKGTISIHVRFADAVATFCTSCLSAIEGEHLMVEVKDTGKGIAFEKLERIFEPFVTDKDIGKGTGMGLAMVHGIIHQHGGHVTAETVRGQGSVFTLYLPKSIKTLTTSGMDMAENTADYVVGKGKKIMVVDDEEMVSSLLREILSNYDFSVEVYNNSVEALRAFERKPDGYDLIITDHTMPDMTGAELSQRVLKQKPTQPIILCTGYSDFIDEAKAREMGIAAFMNKPMRQADLLQKIDELIKR